jgi:hypothetical protein
MASPADLTQLTVALTALSELGKLNADTIKSILNSIAPSVTPSVAPIDPSLQPIRKSEEQSSSPEFDFTLTKLSNSLSALSTHGLVSSSADSVTDNCTCKRLPITDPDSEPVFVYINFDYERRCMYGRDYSAVTVRADFERIRERLFHKDFSVRSNIEELYIGFMTNPIYFLEKLNVFCRVIRSIEYSISVLRKMDRSSESFGTKLINLKRLLQLLVRSSDELKKQLDFTVKADSFRVEWNNRLARDDGVKIGVLKNLLTPYYKHLLILISKVGDESDIFQFLSSEGITSFGPPRRGVGHRQKQEVWDGRVHPRGGRFSDRTHSRY